MNTKRKRLVDFVEFTKDCILRKRDEGFISTANLYEYAMKSYMEYSGASFIPFKRFTRENLHGYYLWMKNKSRDNGNRGLSRNTISSYARMLRSLYNQAKGYARPVKKQFEGIFTGIDTNCKRALDQTEVNRLLHGECTDSELCGTQIKARIIYQSMGMPYIDFSLLSEANIHDGVLSYCRKKTGARISMKMMNGEDHLINKVREYGNSGSRYIMGVLDDSCDINTVGGYGKYQSALHKFNSELKRLAQYLGIKENVSSYTLRHSWATIAKFNGVSIELISEALGHKSIKTTMTYLKKFDIDKLDSANRIANKFAVA